MKTTMMLVHGAWQGAWVWDEVLALLADRDVEAVAFDLPGSGADTTPLEEVDLAGYAQAIIAKARALQPARLILVGHSMGGAAITAAAAQAPELFESLVYVCAFLPRPGESVAALAKEGYDMGGSGPKVEVVASGKATRLLPETIAETFFNDCPPGKAAPLVARFGYQPIAPIVAPASWSEGFIALPKRYIHCACDNAIVPALQLAMAERAGIRDVHTLACGHEPFISNASLLTDILQDAARS